MNEMRRISIGCKWLYEGIVAVFLVSIFGTAAPAATAPLPAWNWEQCQKSGDEAFYQCRYGDADRILTQAVIKGGAFGESDLRFAKSLHSLGSLYTVRGRFVDAEPLLEEEVRVKENVYGCDGLKMIPEYGALIRFYLVHGTASKADPLTDHLLEIVTGRLKNRPAESTGSVKLQKGQPLTASAATAALAVRDPLLDWAITCDELADIYRSRESYDYSEKLYNAALEVKNSVLGQDHISLANSYESLGIIASEKNDDLNAEFYFKDSYDMTEKILGTESPLTYSRLDRLAKCYIKENKLDKAEALYLKAQEFWATIPCRNGTDIRAKYALGSIYVQEKKYVEAIPVLQQALVMAEQFFGTDSISLVPYLQRYADALYYSGQSDCLPPIKERINLIAGTGMTQ